MLYDDLTIEILPRICRQRTHAISPDSHPKRNVGTMIRGRNSFQDTRLNL
jgi:hypothetical protein